MGEYLRVRRERWIWLGLGLLTLAVYWPVTGSEFINFDDPAYVTDNPPVEAGLTVNGLVWALTTGHSSNWHPLTWLSHMADCQWFGLDAGRHHLVSLLFHVANTLLVFAWLRGMTGAVWRSALVAALFGWHPLHVESVAWVSERKDVLSTFFCLLTLIAYGKYARESQVQSPRSKVYYSLALGFYVLGLMSKPMLVTLPFVLLLLDWWPLGRIYDLRLAIDASKRQPKRKSLLPLILEKAPFLVLAAGSSVVTYLVQRAGGAVISVEVLSLGQRLENAVVSYVRYLGKAVWPEGLAMYYPTVKDWPWWQVAGSAVLLLGVTVWVVRERRRRPYLLVGWLWYVGTLVPVIGLVQVGAQALADRYTYIPLLGIFIMVVWGVGEWVGRRETMKPLALGLAAPVLAACLILTSFQVRMWKNSTELYTHALAITSERNVVVQNLLGIALTKLNRNDDAIRHLEKALDYRPDFADAHNNLARALLQKGRAGEAAAHLQRAVELNPGSVDVQNEAGTAYLQNGQVDEAMACFRAALQTDPNFVKARNNLGLALAGKGQTDEAMVCFEAALKIQPAYGQAHNNLGYLLLQEGRVDEAIGHFQKALAIQPGLTDALNNFGYALFQQGKVDEALMQFQKSLALDSADTMVRNNLNHIAWLLATNPDATKRNGAKAVELARQLDKIADGKDPVYLGTLAAAYAETGQFADAVTSAQRALQLAADPANAPLAAALQAQLKLYQAGQPYRETAPEHR